MKILKPTIKLLVFLSPIVLGLVFLYSPASSLITVLTPYVTTTGVVDYEYRGKSVSDAGDINGDGYDDVIVGAYRADGGGNDRGEAYIFFGDSPMDDTADVTLSGESNSDWFGYSVSGAGDVNNDGYADVVVGAHMYGTVHGAAYVFYGGTAMDSAYDVKVTGGSSLDYLGYSVSGAGDVNNDGYDDVIVGAYEANDVGDDMGEVYILFGGDPMDSVVDVTLVGEADFDNLGYSVSGAGDVNDDGYYDVVAGAPGVDGGGSNRGAAYLYLGGDPMDSSADLTFIGVADDDRYGDCVSNAGDVNADGYDDVLVSSGEIDGAGWDRGQADLYLGGSSMDSSADLSFVGQDDVDELGRSSGDAGDVNNDGYGDIVIGADGVGDAGFSNGEVYVFFGGDPMDDVVDVLVEGENDSDKFGSSVAGNANVNGDLYSDIIVGAYSFDDSGTNRGKAYIYSLDYDIPLIDLEDIPDTAVSDTTGTGDVDQSATDIAGVQIQVDSGDWGECDAKDGTFDSTNEDYDCNLSGLSDGVKDVDVRSYDEHGVFAAPSEYASDSFVVDTTPPVYQILPDLGAIINIEEGQTIGESEFLIKVKPVDVTSGVNKARFFAGGELLCTVYSADGEGIYDCLWDTVSNSGTNIQVIAYDVLGNYSLLERNVILASSDEDAGPGAGARILPDPDYEEDENEDEESEDEDSDDFPGDSGSEDEGDTGEDGSDNEDDSGGWSFLGKITDSVTEFVRENETAARFTQFLPAVTSSVATLAIFNLALTDFPNYFLRTFHWIWAVGKERKKGEPWGVVYDSVTKAPVSRAVVRLFSGGRLIDTAVTNVNGVFTFAPVPGEYKMSVTRSGYDFPTQVIVGDSDGDKENIYRGGEYLVKKDEELVSIYIPIDHKEMSEFKKNYHKVASAVSSFILFVNPAVLLIGAVISFGFYAEFGGKLNILFGFLYLALIGLHYYMKSVYKVKLGKILDRSGNPIEGLKIGLYDAIYDRLIETRVTNSLGQYQFIVPGGKYVLKPISKDYVVSDQAFSDGYPVGKKSKKDILIARDIELRKAGE